MCIVTFFRPLILKEEKIEKGTGLQHTLASGNFTHKPNVYLEPA